MTEPKPPLPQRALVIAGLAALCWLALAVAWMCWTLWPAPTVSFVAGGAVASLVAWWMRAGLREELANATAAVVTANNSAARDDLAAVKLDPERTEAPQVYQYNWETEDDTGQGTIAYLSAPAAAWAPAAPARAEQ